MIDEIKKNEHLVTSNFSLEVEKYVRENKTTYMDAVIGICEKEEIEIESMKGALNELVKNKIMYEARSLRMMKDNELPESLFG